jgi:hypothetical protein
MELSFKVLEGRKIEKVIENEDEEIVVVLDDGKSFIIHGREGVGISVAEKVICKVCGKEFFAISVLGFSTCSMDCLFK